MYESQSINANIQTIMLFVFFLLGAMQWSTLHMHTTSSSMIFYGIIVWNHFCNQHSDLTTGSLMNIAGNHQSCSRKFKRSIKKQTAAFILGGIKYDYWHTLKEKKLLFLIYFHETVCIDSLSNNFTLQKSEPIQQLCLCPSVSIINIP